MLFNSYIFLFIFVPLLILVVSILSYRQKIGGCIWVLLVASLIYYCWWNPAFLPLIIGLIVVNHLLAKCIDRTATLKSLLLFVGVVFNLLPLFFFKYANFVIDTLNFLPQMSLRSLGVILPIGISFFTFQQIAYLVDVRRGLVQPCHLLEYALFVSFFPKLIAGPIVHHNDFIPQLRTVLVGMSFDNLNRGVAIFAVGLFKKTALADNLSVLANPVFNTVADGNLVNMLDAWVAALAYTFQIYFDFSGYSDMAVGLGFMFGIKLPINFYSPYKSVNIIDFWRRWHITLSTFLRDYIYIPLGGGRVGEFRRIMNVFTTMLIGGIWHGAGWTFLLWGAIHGVAISINHVWRIKVRDSRRSWIARFSPFPTFIFIVFTWVAFRSTTIEGTWSLWKIMVGTDQLILPVDWVTPFQNMGLNVIALGEYHGTPLAIILVSAVVAWMLPNTRQLFPDISLDQHGLMNKASYFCWKPNVLWLIVVFACFLMSLWNMSRISEFLYYQF